MGRGKEIKMAKLKTQIIQIITWHLKFFLYIKEEYYNFEVKESELF